LESASARNRVRRLPITTGSGLKQSSKVAPHGFRSIPVRTILVLSQQTTSASHLQKLVPAVEVLVVVTFEAAGALFTHKPILA
jgi:hypothetical protein